MKLWLRTIFTALGFATLAAVWIPGPLNRDAFYWGGPSLTLFVPSVLDFCLVWLVSALVLYRVRSPGRARRIVWSTILAFSPILALESYALLPGTYLSSTLRLTVGLLCFLGWILMLTVFSGIFARHGEPIIGAASVVLIFLSFNGLYVLAHSVWLGWQARNLNPLHAEASVLRPPVADHHRILWIMMDELSYQQVYGRRLPGLSLPAFDALAAESSVFTRITPAANMTEFSMPDYLTGIPDGQDIYSPNGQLDIARLDNGRRAPFNQFDTIFHDAQIAGFNTGVAGWFIPYCRLLSNVTDRCMTSYTQPNRNGMIGSSSLVANLFAPGRRVAAYLVPNGTKIGGVTFRSNGIVEREQHIEDLRLISQAADAMFRDPRMDFVLIHLPVPHLPGIYDRRRASLDASQRHGYVDNLALADQCLAHFRSVLEAAGQWDSSTVLVMGDHGWRLMAMGPGDEPAAVGGFDPRPAYIVKLAGQHQPETIDAPYDAMRTRSLLQALIHRQIRTPQELSTWVQRAP
jgi:hypothetical protein